ncbi:hypothetical protein Nepgr_016287 [Nepenthes gracilis]|uniref:Uncharacterized protein n=1 Tax=Nepenthes gracilis TaxID=150966 RepID=A0AAD3XS51_NEPGR|nr:hypothetical protein Nepgr_016287 [Nepenthes gracilis]
MKNGGYYDTTTPEEGKEGNYQKKKEDEEGSCWLHVAQRRCELCGGSGLVLRDKSYFRCPGCGGFLPWQSWKRFFSG